MILDVEFRVKVLEVLVDSKEEKIFWGVWDV